MDAGGGYVVTPVNKGKQCVVKHMLAVDWKLWRLYLRPTASRTLTVRMLERVAALREMFKSKGEGEMVLDTGMPATPACEKEDMSSVKTGGSSMDLSGVEQLLLADVEDDDALKESTGRTSLVGLHESADEFFDVPEPIDYDDHPDNDWQFDDQPFQTPFHPILPTPAGFVKKLQELAVQKKGYMEIQDIALETDEPAFGTTLPKDSTCELPCSWAESDPSLYLIRGPTYLTDNQKVKAIGSLMQLVGVDWLRSSTREDNLSSRPSSIVQKYAAAGGSEFFFVVNIQFPGNPLYSVALYYMMRAPLEDNHLLHSFVEGDDAYRNSRFKLIPYISKGSWVVKQSVGKKACLLGQALEVQYIRGKNYLELDINVGSSTVASGVVNLVLGYLNNLVIEMAFLIQGNTQEELPEGVEVEGEKKKGFKECNPIPVIKQSFLLSGFEFLNNLHTDTRSIQLTVKKGKSITEKMIEPNFVDDVDCGSFFDHIDDLLDFPADDAATADASLPVGAACAGGNFETPASFWSSESNSALPVPVPATDTAFPGGDAVTDLSAEISVPYEDIVQLEWLSTFVEDSFSGRSLTMKKVDPPSTTTSKEEDLTRSQFRTSSPVSVLESSSSCSVEKVAAAQCPEIYIPVVPCGRARSKRQRPASFKPHPVMHLISPASSVGENTQPNVIVKASSDSENFAESHPKQAASGDHKKKKKSKAPNPLAEDDDNDNDGNQNGGAVRKCMHCEITKTPQWRAGPMGPKTLCNACGVRYKSGRLFPEYRPAASPTFCPAVHSNSHKKVLEMRNKFGCSTHDSPASPELIPNTSRLGLEYM
ncbi:hypothetical protein PIB30_024369 [Stylosanthes scabra]|uniref:GATA-type domain-containing protein n=1 Tax=Stylosanthes scabra TaxID=79078 RepID=A0ABU6R9Z5_9FABA|nr:hypothetical protein [Stylosanthes scabra]